MLLLRPSTIARASSRLGASLPTVLRPCAATAATSRSLCAKSGGDEKSEVDSKVGGVKLPPLVEENLTGVGQVIFLGSPACGAMVLGALGYADPWLGSLAALGTVSATLSARICGLDGGAISAGLMGYNGCLVGCAFSVFLGMPAWSPAAALATVAGAAASAPVAAALKPACGSVPQFTLAFNITTLSVLMALRPLAGAAPADPASTLTALEWALSPLVGISQIFVVNDAISGAMILGAIGERLLA